MFKLNINIQYRNFHPCCHHSNITNGKGLFNSPFFLSLCTIYDCKVRENVTVFDAINKVQGLKKKLFCLALSKNKSLVIISILRTNNLINNGAERQKGINLRIYSQMLK